MKKLIILLLLVCSFWVNAQKTSTEYISELCSQDLLVKFFSLKEKNPRVSLNDSSRTALVNVGTQHKLGFNIQEGKDYTISLFLTDIYRTDSLRFEILDVLNGTSLYNNEKNLSPSFQFTSYSQRELTLKIDIPGEFLNKNINEYIITKETQTGCLVVLIEEELTFKTGF